MSIAALFTIVKIQKKPKCPPTGEWIKKMCYTHTHTQTHTKMEYYSATKRMKSCHLQQREWTWRLLC